MGMNVSRLQTQAPLNHLGVVPTNDPMFGFPEGRQERPKPKSGPLEWDAAGLQPWQRDYCADYLLDYLGCKKANWFWPLRCRHEQHHYEDCQFEDYTLRLMERERERRLLMRERRKAGLQENPTLGLERATMLYKKTLQDTLAT